jgi:hypothetical protein
LFDKSGQRHLCWEFACASFTVVGPFVGTAPVQLTGNWTTTPVLDVQHGSDRRSADSETSRPKALS